MPCCFGRISFAFRFQSYLCPSPPHNHLWLCGVSPGVRAEPWVPIVHHPLPASSMKQLAAAKKRDADCSAMSPEQAAGPKPCTSFFFVARVCCDLQCQKVDVVCGANEAFTATPLPIMYWPPPVHLPTWLKPSWREFHRE